MSIKIYHGDNGSYKSASCVQYDIIPELKKGRTVVTNLRGCTLAKCLEVYPDLPDSADIIHIDMTEIGSREKLRTWFRWVPVGALIVLDEVQLIHLKAWKEKELAAYRFDGTEDEAEAAKTPYDLLDAFTRHRHWNWDLVLTTPNISYVRQDIRDTTEMCYLQANLAVLGYRGRFKRVMHKPNSKPTRDNITSSHTISQESFKCYESTDTGEIRDTRAGTNAFKSPRLLLALGIAVAALGYSFSSGGLDYFIGGGTDVSGNQAKYGAEVDKPASSEVSGVPSESDSGSSGDLPVVRVSDKSVHPAPDAVLVIDPFSDFEVSILGFVTGSGKSTYMFQLSENGRNPFLMNSAQMRETGYLITGKGPCLATLLYRSLKRKITCGGYQSKVRVAGA